MNEKKPLLHLGHTGSRKNDTHQTKAIMLSDLSDCVSKSNREISKDASIRYQRASSQQFVAASAKDLGGKKSLCSMSGPRACSFTIGVFYTIFALAAASASLGYRFDIENDGYGFRALLEGTAVLSIVTFLASLGLIYGVIESRSSFISAWLVVQVVVPLYSAVFYLWAIFASGNKTDFGPVRNFMPFVAMVAAVHVLVMIGCTMVVNNYYVFLKTRETLQKKKDDILE